MANNHDSDIPPGFLFIPTDEELVHYLIAKIRNPSQSYSYIPEVDVYAYSPMELAAKYKFGGESAGYFFTPMSKKYPNGNRPTRSAHNGLWKPSRTKQITFNGKEIGMVRTLRYNRGSGPGQPTDWLMQEYLPGTDIKKFHKFVAVKIYKKRGANNDNLIVDNPIVENVHQLNSTLQVNDVSASQSSNFPVIMGPSSHQQLQVQAPYDQNLLDQTQYGQQIMDQTQSFPWTSQLTQIVEPGGQALSIDCSDNPSSQTAISWTSELTQIVEPCGQPSLIECSNNQSSQAGPSSHKQLHFEPHYHQQAVDQAQYSQQLMDQTIYDQQFINQDQSYNWTQVTDQSLSIDPLPNQQLHLEPHYHQQPMDQTQSFWQIPEPIQEDPQYASYQSAQVGTPQDQLYPFKARYVQQFMAQGKPVSWNTEPIQVPEPAARSVSMEYLYDDAGLMNTDSDFDQFFDSPINQEIILEEESATAQQQGGQISADKNDFNTDDLQFNLEWHDCGFQDLTAFEGGSAKFIPVKCTK